MQTRQLSWSPLKRHPSALLLAAQLLSLLLYAAMDDTEAGRVLFGLVGVAVLLLAVWVVNRSPALNWIAWLIALPAIALTALGLLLARPDLLVLSALLHSLLYFYAAVGLIAYMMVDQTVSADELFAAGATFTLLVWGFAYAYLVCQAWEPGSFTGLRDPSGPRTWVEFLALSFANFSATGLGDVLPLSASARVLAMLEQFAGVAYIAVVVSRLIGLTLIRKGR